jgi:fatty acid desaturase
MDERILKSFKRSDVPRELLGGADIKKLYQYTAIDLGIIIICWYLMFNTPAYLYPLWGIIIAGRFHAFGVILHDLAHMNVKNKNWKWRILEILIGYPIGTTINAMAYHHNRHHRNTLMDNDPYFKINKKCSTAKRVILAFGKGIIFVPFWITRSYVGTIATYVPALRPFYAKIFLQDVNQEDWANHAETIECCREDRWQALFHTILIALTFKYEAILYGYYYLMPIGGIFCIWRLLVEHEYDIVEDRSIYTMIECTFDHHLDFVGQILFAPRNIGYHCMHHIHPAVGLHNLPKLRTWYLENCYSYAKQFEEEIGAVEATGFSY